jgi:NAD(P)-dependent dehydrogenase (short-subunit alcohol dehydrogenase family)
MSSEQMVAIITGASQGIGAGVMQAHRQLGYVVVANSRHITPSSDPGVLTVPGDIADPETGARLVDRAVDCFGRVEVSPGIIRTPMHAEETYDTLAALHPVGRMGGIGDIVDAIVYLETAEFITGEILHVDGGQSAGH